MWKCMRSQTCRDDTDRNRNEHAQTCTFSLCHRMLISVGAACETWTYVPSTEARPHRSAAARVVWWFRIFQILTLEVPLCPKRCRIPKFGDEMMVERETAYLYIKGGPRHVQVYKYIGAVKELLLQIHTNWHHERQVHT